MFTYLDLDDTVQIENRTSAYGNNNESVSFNEYYFWASNRISDVAILNMMVILVYRCNLLTTIMQW